MAVAPEPYFSAFQWVLERAIISCRFGNWQGEFSSEHTADLMDAIHNIPPMIRNWRPDDLEFLRASLQDYETKWLAKGGIALCQIFDDLICDPESLRAITMDLGQAFLSWRKERVTIEQVELSPFLDHEAPLGDDSDEWRRLKGLVQANDEIWTFCSPQEEWDRHMGWQGLILVRDGKLIDVVVTAQN
jgi:hypothetical protein